MLHGSSRTPVAKRRGFTLLELALATSLVSMVALGFAAVYNTSQAYMISTITTSDLQGDAAFALRHIARNLRAATITGVEGVSGFAGLSVTVPPPGSYTTGAPAVTMAYFFNNAGSLVWIPNVLQPGTRTTLARNVTAFQAVDDTNGAAVTNTTRVVRVTITTFRANRNFVITTSTSMRGKT